MFRSFCILGLIISFSSCSINHNEQKPIEDETNENNENENNDPPVEEIDDYSRDILLTEISTGTRTVDRAVEISNIGEEDLSLDNYALNIYRNYSDEPTEIIPLDGHAINQKSTFVIAYDTAKQEILDKADLVTEDYLNDGTFPVSLSYKGKIIDAIGVIGYIYDFAKNAVLVRLKEHFTQSVEFHNEDWIRYPINSIDTLGNYDVVDEETLLSGPRLSSEDFSKPFCTDGSQGDGGALEVSLVWTSDGDTTGFNYGNQYSEYGISGSESTRYYGINTPEIAHSSGEVSDPYGDEAKAFTNNLLRKAKRYVVQSVNGYSFRETYGRMLGYVWISNVDNPKPEDYQLLNYLIIKNGFSRPAFISRDANYNSLMTYEGVSFIEYLYYAETYASIHELNIFSK